VFRDKAGGEDQVTNDGSQSLKRTSKHVEPSDASLDATTVEIHNKIRAVNDFKCSVDGETILNVLHA
jgi:hypothetical protein